MANANVLIVGDNSALLRAVRRALYASGHACTQVPYDISAVESALEKKFEICVVDGDAPADRLGPSLELLRSTIQPERFLMLSDQYDEMVSRQVLEGAANNTIAKTSAFSVVSHRIDETELMITCRKILSGRVFGLHRNIRGGPVPVYRSTIESLGERQTALEELEGYMRPLEVPRSLNAAILTVADELLMNAIFNAPTDASGAPKYRERSRSEDLQLEPHERVKFKYCCDGKYLFLSVEDSFGLLERETIMRYIGSGLLKQKGHMEEKAYGAGLGLFMVFSSINQLTFNIERGRRCEIIAGFYIREGLRGFREAGQSLNFFISR